MAWCVIAVLSVACPVHAQYRAIGQDFIIQAGATSTSTVEKMRVTQTGRVGIGTVSPQTVLDVSGTLQTSGVSLTTTGVTWGYLASVASYIPKLTTDNISVTTINGVAPSALSSPTNVPLFNANKNGTSQTGIASNVYTKLTFPTKLLDSTSNFDTSTSRYTPNVVGNYLFRASARCAAGTTTTCYVAIYKNGVNIFHNGTTSADAVTTATGVVSMNGTTDYVEAYIYTNGSSVTGEVQGTNFSGSLMASGNGLAGTEIIPSGLVAAFDLSGCPAGWTEYTAARGRFLRGIDNGAGNDPDGTRSPGATQADEFKSHTHGFPDSLLGAAGTAPTTNRGGSSAVSYYTGTSAAGGTETRPKNVAVLFCRKD